jgi:NAD(P)-dependent dehydrogenase (short-subunit alcohol dehydrogenase family)
VHVLGRRDRDAFMSAADAIGPRAHYHTVDLTDADAGVAALQDAARALGRVDILINCAGVMTFENAADASGESVSAQLAVNLATPIRLCAAMVARMLEQEPAGGHIVNLASVAALKPTPKLAVYAAAKAGLVHYSRSIAAELAGKGVRVNVVCPGAIATNLAPRVHFKLIERTVPLKQLQTAEEIAELVVYLLSNAARNVTGSVFTLDGGMAL